MALLKPSRNIVLYQRKGEEVKKKKEVNEGFHKAAQNCEKETDLMVAKAAPFYGCSFSKPLSHSYNRKCRQAFMSLVITTAATLLIAIRSTRRALGLRLIIS